MSEVIFQVNADFPINQLTKYFLHNTPYTPLLFHRKNCAVHGGNFLKTSTFTTFLVVLTLYEICYISYKDEPPNNLVKYQYFYTRDFISLLHFEKKFALSIVESFKNIYFLPVLLVLTLDELCYISYKYQPFTNHTNNLPKHQYFYMRDFIFLRLSKKNERSPLQTFFETSTFYQFFTIFKNE